MRSTLSNSTSFFVLVSATSVLVSSSSKTSSIFLPPTLIPFSSKSNVAACFICIPWEACGPVTGYGMPILIGFWACAHTTEVPPSAPIIATTNRTAYFLGLIAFSSFPSNALYASHNGRSHEGALSPAMSRFNNTVTRHMVEDFRTVFGNQYHILESYTTNPELAFPAFNRKHHARLKNLRVF